MDFALVSGLLTLVFVAVVQLAIVVHVRNTLADCASDGARLGALAGSDPEAGVRRTQALITADLSSRYAGQVSAGRETVAGLDTVVIRIQAPLIALFGLGRVITVEGHALAEQP